MVIYRVFDEIFRTWSNVAVMRALVDTNTGFTGNEVARTAGMHPNSALKALTLLEGLGIVNRQIGGRDHIFTLNRDHYLYQEVLHNIFRVESAFTTEIIKALASIFKGHVYSAVIFGSTARREENILSDLDICCIVNVPLDLLQVRGLLDKKAQMLNKKYGIKLAPLIFLKEQFMKKRKTGVIKDIINEGILITGKHPKVLING